MHADCDDMIECNTMQDVPSETDMAGEETTPQHNTNMRRTQHKSWRTTEEVPCSLFQISATIKLPACTQEHKHAIHTIENNSAVHTRNAR